MFITVSLAGLLPLGLLSQVDVGPPQQQQQQGQQTLQQRLNKIESEYVEVATKINQVEQKALNHEKVSQAKEKFEKKLDKAIIETKPELKDKLKEQKRYSKYLDKAQAGEQLPAEVDINEIYAKYNAIQQEIIPVRQQVIEKPEIKSAYDKYQEMLVSKMEEIEPGLNEQIEKRNKLVSEYQRLVGQAQQRSQEQGARGQQQRGQGGGG